MGFLSWIRESADGIAEPPTPFIIHVMEETGRTAEVLTAFDGSRTFKRGASTVFATIEDVREDAWRRIQEA